MKALVEQRITKQHSTARQWSTFVSLHQAHRASVQPVQGGGGVSSGCLMVAWGVVALSFVLSALGVMLSTRLYARAEARLPQESVELPGRAASRLRFAHRLRRLLLLRRSAVRG